MTATTTRGLCRSCGRPFRPSHDIHAPGPTVRHPFMPTHPPHPLGPTAVALFARERTPADAETAIRNQLIYREARASDADLWIVLGELERLGRERGDLLAENDTLRTAAANWSDNTSTGEAVWTVGTLRFAARIGYGIRIGRDSLPVLAGALDAATERDTLRQELKDLHTYLTVTGRDPIETGTEAALGDAEEKIHRLREDIAERDAAIKDHQRRYGRTSRQIGDLRNLVARLRAERNEAEDALDSFRNLEASAPAKPLRDLLDTALGALVTARIYGAGDEGGWRAKVEAAIDRVSAAIGAERHPQSGPSSTGVAAGDEFIEGARRYVAEVAAGGHRAPAVDQVLHEAVAEADRNPAEGRRGLPEVAVSTDHGKTWHPVTVTVPGEGS